MNWTRTSLVAVIAASITGIVTLSADAQEHQIPTAPANYVEKTNPSAGKPEAIAKGKTIYEKRCARCHGEKGDGLGKSAKDLNPPVPTYRGGYLKGRSDGQLFWIVEKGSPETDMEAFGPGTSFNLSHDEIWSVISFLRSKFND